MPSVSGKLFSVELRHNHLIKKFKNGMGATLLFHGSFLRRTPLRRVKRLQEEGVKVYAMEQVQHSISLEDFLPQSTGTAIIFGHEMDGVSQEVIDLCDGSIEIRQEGYQALVKCICLCGNCLLGTS
jgi:tRNA G18 (ribose-2'-O)-methylase SpoU